MQRILVKGAMDEMMLRQLGADVISFHGLQCYVKFIVQGVEISYTYNINAKQKYFLQRIKPYPMNAGVFENVNDVVNSIKIDYEQFKNAIKSGNFQKFIDINRSAIEAARNLEDLFLYYNVSPDKLEELKTQIDGIREKILKCAQNSPRIYFEKEPESL